MAGLISGFPSQTCHTFCFKHTCKTASLNPKKCFSEQSTWPHALSAFPKRRTNAEQDSPLQEPTAISGDPLLIVTMHTTVWLQTPLPLSLTRSRPFRRARAPSVSAVCPYQHTGTTGHAVTVITRRLKAAESDLVYKNGIPSVK